MNRSNKLKNIFFRTPAVRLLLFLVLFVFASFTACAPDHDDEQLPRWGWGQQDEEVPIAKLSDAFRYSPSSQFAPADGGVDVDWVDGANLKIAKVTTLANDGEGSLRRVLEQERGLRLVVFEVGGVIDLEGKTLTIPAGHGDVIVAGQTAPSPGITIIRDAFNVRAKNVIIQHIRIRTGDDIISEGERPVGEGYAEDAMSLGGSCYDGNQIVDHCSVTWGSDETLSVYASSSDPGPGQRSRITISNTIIANGLRNSPLHPENPHHKGTLLYRGFVHSYVGNLIANVENRTPWIGAYGGCDALVINNLMHSITSSQNTIMIEPSGKMRVVIIGNEFSMEPKAYNLDVTRGDDQKPKDIYLKDNEYTRVFGSERWDFRDEPPISLHTIKPLAREFVIEHHLQTVGARPADRSPLDKRLIGQVVEKRGEFIDSQDDVGGYPDFGPPVYRKLNVPTDPAELGKWFYEHTRAVELWWVQPPR